MFDCPLEASAGCLTKFSGTVRIQCFVLAFFRLMVIAAVAVAAPVVFIAVNAHNKKPLLL